MKVRLKLYVDVDVDDISNVDDLDIDEAVQASIDNGEAIEMVTDAIAETGYVLDFDVVSEAGDPAPETPEGVQYTRGALMDKIRTIPAGEPIFVVRGQDILAAETVSFWAQSAFKSGVSERKASEAFFIAHRMREFPAKKLPD